MTFKAEIVYSMFAFVEQTLGLALPTLDHFFPSTVLRKSLLVRRFFMLAGFLHLFFSSLISVRFRPVV